MTYGGNAGTIELVVETLTGDPENDWLFEPMVPASWSQSRRCSDVFTSQILVRRRTLFSLPGRNEDGGNLWPSLGTERRHRLHAGRPARRQIARKQRDDREDARH